MLRTVGYCLILLACCAWYVGCGSIDCGPGTHEEDYADSPKGKIAATLAVPLAGGAAVPIDSPVTGHWKSSGDGVMYIQKALRYLNLP